MRTGIIGLAGSGKTTLFRILTRGHAPQGAKHGAVHVGVAQVPDARVVKLAINLVIGGLAELMAEALGEHVFEWFIRNKRAEWFDYKSAVTQFELDRYLPNW